MGAGAVRETTHDAEHGGGDETQFIAALRAGEESAFVELIDRYHAGLVGHLTGTSPLLHELESASDWFARTSSGTAEWMAASVGTLATGSSFAGPLEGCRIRVPGTSGGLEPFDQLRWVGGRL